MWALIVKLETEKYDMEERMKRQDYDVSLRLSSSDVLGAWGLLRCFFRGYIDCFLSLIGFDEFFRSARCVFVCILEWFTGVWV